MWVFKVVMLFLQILICLMITMAQEGVQNIFSTSGFNDCNIPVPRTADHQSDCRIDEALAHFIPPTQEGFSLLSAIINGFFS